MKRSVLCLALCAASLAAQAPVNDEPAGAIPVFDGINPNPPGGVSGTWFSNVGATTSVGYPVVCGSGLHSDVFFSYAPSVTGVHMFTMAPPAGFQPGTMNDSTLNVYDAAAPTTSIACDDDGVEILAPGTSGFLSRVAVQLTAGSTYLLRVSSWSATIQGSFYVNVFAPTANGGEDCATAVAIADGAYAGNHFGATASGAVVAGCTSFTATTIDHYYSYVAPATGECIISEESPGSTRTMVTTGACGAEVLVTGACITTAYLRFPVTAGTTYNIRFGIATAPATALAGVYNFTIATVPLLGNNDCITAAPLAAGDNFAPNVGNTPDGTVAACATGFTVGTNNDGWWSYTPSAPGVQTISAQGPNGTFQMALYLGGACGALGPATCQAAAGTGVSLTVTNAAAATVWVRLGVTTLATNGVFNINVLDIPFPANDDCAGAGASPLAVGLNGPFNNLGASNGAVTASCTTSFRDTWHSFTAPITATLKIHGCGSGGDPVFSVWDACGGVELACDDDDLANLGPCAVTQTLNPYLEVPVTAGTTYLLRVANNTDATMTYSVTLEFKFSLTIVGNPGAQTVTITDTAGLPGNVAINAITLNQGAYPNGWFYGVDIPVFELFLTAGSFAPPFFFILDANGNATITYSGIPQPLGLTFYAVGAQFTIGGIFVNASDPISVAL
ncbi:MAG TPA: hypothetical protein VEI02_00455 [Planctomycetota bacterium]|nr:hypothetical protein [Planctomycetota bacterium]